MRHSYRMSVNARARPFPATIQENQQPSEDTSAAKKAAAKTVWLWEGVGLFWEQITAAAVGRVMGDDPIVE